jgi:hypothetical protein
LGRLEAVAGREGYSPRGDLLRGGLADATVAEYGSRLGEQPAQLVDRHLLHVMLSQIRLDQLRQGQ